NVRNVVAAEHEVFLMAEIMQIMKGHPFDDVPAIAIYYCILMTLTEPEKQSHFHELTTLLKEHASKFRDDEAREMYVYAQNYCLRKINTGETDYLSELFALYKNSLKDEFILEERKLSPWSYKNIVATALRLNEFDWVKNFITVYRTKLDPKFRDNAFNYNLARFYFYQQNYNKVLDLLQKVEFNDVFYSLDSRSMMLKTYYELEAIDSLYSLIDSFRLYLWRNKLISEGHRHNYLNLIRFVRRLTKVFPGDDKKLLQIETDIEQTKQIADKNWLLEKLKSLY
ncbi:MAG: hypothetical protein IH946_09410, partial [Bacteroidetes bacterium]|nr:hypothetical protein [Bacteroidota bacterium]